MLWACGSNSGQKETAVRTVADIEQEFASTLSASDTTCVLALATEFLDSIKAGNVQWAVETLCELDSTGRVMPLGEDSRKRVARRFEMFPVVSYELDYYSFFMPTLNDLKYRTYFGERQEGETGGPSMAVMFNPVKDSGQWYLCLKEASQPAKDAANALNPDPVSYTHLTLPTTF